MATRRTRSSPQTLVSWACEEFDKKWRAVDRLDADLIVVQGCEDPRTSTSEAYRRWASNHLWVGEPGGKGLGVFAKWTLKLQRLDWNAGDLKYFLLCRINERCQMVAVWCQPSSTMPEIGQLGKYLERHDSSIGSETIVIGNFNSNEQFKPRDRTWNHYVVVGRLENLGLYSLYHQQHDRDHGDEDDPTFYLYGSDDYPYHLDYCFLPKNLIAGAHLRIADDQQ